MCFEIYYYILHYSFCLNRIDIKKKNILILIYLFHIARTAGNNRRLTYP